MGVGPLAAAATLAAGTPAGLEPAPPVTPSINSDAVERMCKRLPDLDLNFIESGGDNLAATFSPELPDLAIYVIDVAGGVSA